MRLQFIIGWTMLVLMFGLGVFVAIEYVPH